MLFAPEVIKELASKLVVPVPPCETKIVEPPQIPVVILPTVTIFEVPAHVESLVFSTSDNPMLAFVISAQVPLLVKKEDSDAPKEMLELFTLLLSLLSVITNLSPLPIVAVVVIIPALVRLPWTCPYAAAPPVAPSLTTPAILLVPAGRSALTNALK